MKKLESLLQKYAADEQLAETLPPYQSKLDELKAAREKREAEIAAKRADADKELSATRGRRQASRVHRSLGGRR